MKLDKTLLDDLLEQAAASPRLRMNLFRPNTYVEVGKEGIDAKIKALSMYRGVMRPYPHPRSAEYITGLAAMRGGQWGLEYAEGFECVVREY